MTFRSAISYVGVVLEILGIIILIPVFFSWLFNEQTHSLFLLAALISFITGTIFDKKFPKEEITLASAMVISALSFVLASVIGAVPYLHHMNFVDAVFESVSGFTTTGLSVIVPEELPNSLLLWRSLTQWIGGIGIILIFLLLVNSPGISSYYLYKAEGRQEKIEATVRHTVRSIFWIYGIYTLLGIILLCIAGMPLFDAVIHTFSSISTGGFSSKSQSIGFYTNPAIEVVIIFLMVAGSTSFLLHNRIFKLEIRKYASNPETKVFWFLAVTFSIFLSFAFLHMPDSVRHGIFHAFSALTTTGFTTLNMFPEGLPLFLLAILMIIGGYAGSTAGGIKIVRALAIGKAIPWLGKKMSLPEEAVVPLKIGERIIKLSEMAVISIFVCIYFLVLGLSTMVLVFLGYPLSHAFFESASAEGTVGLSVISLKDMHPLGKFILMIDMLLGRLEIFPFLVIIYLIYKNIANKIKQKF